MSGLSDVLEPLAAWFRGLGMPEVIVHWGHPVMMGIVVVAMGSAVGLTGWKGRTLANKDPEGAAKNRADHSKIAPLMFMFLAMGYTGGVLSLVVQQKPILESPHFWTGSTVILLLTINALFAAIGFGGGALRSTHAYVGSAILALFVIHMVLGVSLGLSI
jgi:F0F1-type ATP synthase membrane subunit c/vacuolar-type H+-ATPase subunit K